MRSWLVLWALIGIGRWTWYFIESFDGVKLWRSFSREERAYYEPNLWFFDGIGLIWSIFFGPVYLVIDLYRALFRKSQAP